MKKPATAFLVLVPFALMLACGEVGAQLKPPAKSKPQAPLGSGLSTPAPAPAPAPATPSVAQEPLSTDAVIQGVANCMLAGLPANWVLAQIEVIELGRDGKQREFEAKYSYRDADDKSAAFSPCDPREPAMNVYKLNAALAADKRNWIKATLVFSKEGKFELQYDYAKKDTEKDNEKDAGKGANADAAKK